VVPVTGTTDTLPHWADADARPDGVDFETTLPGGEQDRLYSLETPAEMLKLVSRVFWHVDTSPESLSSQRVADADDAGSAHAVGFEARTAGDPAHRMPPSGLPYRTIGAGG
jgi:hypothetical protein